jgi:hypothetical protein
MVQGCRKNRFKKSPSEGNIFRINSPFEGGWGDVA